MKKAVNTLAWTMLTCRFDRRQTIEEIKQIERRRIGKLQAYDVAFPKAIFLNRKKKLCT